MVSVRAGSVDGFLGVAEVEAGDGGAGPQAQVLDEVGRRIIQCCLANGTLSDYEKLIDHETLMADS